MKAKSLLFIFAVLAVFAVIFLMFGPTEPGKNMSHSSTATAPDMTPRPNEENPTSPILEVASTERAAVSIPAGVEEMASAALGAGVLKGRIVEAGGTPVPDYLVEAYGGNGRIAFPSVENWFEEKTFALDWKAAGMKTDAEGRFELRGLPSRAMYVMGLGIGGSRPQFRILDMVPNAGQVIDLGDIPLDPYIILTGRILDEKGNPIPGARIRASAIPSIVIAAGMGEVRPDGALLVLAQGRRGGMAARRNNFEQVFTAPSWMRQLLEKFPVPTTHSGSDGKFRLEGAPMGSVTVVVDATDKPNLMHGPFPSGNAGGEKDLGDLRMEEGETLEGKVVDSQGKGIPDAQIFAGPRSSMAPFAIMRKAGVSDAEGKFSVKGMKDAASYAVARVDAASPWGISEEISPGSEEARIQIDTGLDLIVRLKGSDGKEVANPEILLKSAVAAEQFPVLFPPVPLSGRLARDPDGAYRIQRLNSGEYMIIARAPGYALTMQKATIEKESPTIEMTLKAAAATKIAVIDKTSQAPVANARIAARPADSKNWTIHLASAQTDASGQALLPALAPGTYMFEASHPSFGTEAVLGAVPQESITIALDGAGIVEGRVHEAGRVPDQPRMLFFEPRGNRDFFAMPRVTSTDLEGKYRVTNLEPGEYKINVQHRTLQKGMMDLFQMMQGGPQKRVSVTALAGKTVNLDIDLSGSGIDGAAGKLRGHITMNGRAAASVTVSTWKDGRLTATTDAGGYFEMDVPAGENWVSVALPAPAGQVEPYRLGSRNIDVKEGEVVEASWNFNTGVLRGRVVMDKDGSPGAFLVVTGSIRNGEGKGSTNSWVNTTTDKFGEFRFDPAPSGKWNLTVQGSGFARPSVAAEIGEGEDMSGIEIRLQDAVKVAGKVILPGKTENQWMWISFRQEKNSRQGGASVDTEKMTFECDNIGPGKYFVDLNTWSEGKQQQQWETLTVEVPSQGEENLVLEFQPKAPPPPKPAK